MDCLQYDVFSGTKDFWSRLILIIKERESASEQIIAALLSWYLHLFN